MNGTVTIRVAGKADVPAILEVYAQPAVDAGEVLSNEAAIALLQRFEHYPNYQLYDKLTLSAASQRGNAHKFYESLGFERHGYSFRISLDAA